MSLADNPIDGLLETCRSIESQRREELAALGFIELDDFLESLKQRFLAGERLKGSLCNVEIINSTVYISVGAWAEFRMLKLKKTESSLIGRKAKAYCNENHIDIYRSGGIIDFLATGAGMYPIKVLDQILIDDMGGSNNE